MEFIAQPQVDDTHYQDGYDTRARWSSYWIQIQEALRFEGGAYLEIGPGNGVVSAYIEKTTSTSVTTVDIDARLKPDVVADIADLPFGDSTFECAIACEVLEHMPLEHARMGLHELRRVSANAIVSIPDARRYIFQGFVSVGNRRKRLFSFDFSRFLPSSSLLPLIPEHYWELNRNGLTIDAFCGLLEETGWSVTREYRNPDCPYHHFFVLTRNPR